MLHQKSFNELRSLYGSGAVSPVEVAISAIEHAESVNSRINALALLDRPRALIAAERSHRRWRAGTPLGYLDGMPLTIKEFAAVEGWPTRRGSAVTTGEPVPTSTVFAERLLGAGITPLGKTRAPEFNWKGVTDSPAFGVTRNPWNTNLTPGGSSGGCSAAVSAGIVRVSLGSDAGGSIRIPAAFTGLLGLKPSFGRIPASPIPSAFSQVVNTGPIAAGIHDLAEVMQVISGPSGRDWTSFTGSTLDWVAALSLPITALRIGVLASARWAEADPEVKAGMDLVVKLFEGGGLQVVEVDFDVAAASEVGAIFYRIGCAAAIRSVPLAQRHLLDKDLIEYADGLDAVPLTDYLAACGRRDEYANRLAMLFESVDVLALPTVPILPFEANRMVPAGWHSNDWMSWNPYTPAFNIAQVPALSYPVWPDSSALPVGIQLVAPRHCDDRLVAIGAWLEPFIPVRLSPLANNSRPSL